MEDHEYVRIQYRGRDGSEIEEVDILVTDGSVNPTVTDEVSISVDMLRQPGKFLLEDDQGLWYLDEIDLISMKPATRDEYESHWSDMHKQSSHLWN
jgi:hypothetical protein